MRVAGIVVFFALLYAVDRALARWGSAAIRRRPRPGLRVTVVFGCVVAGYAAMAVLAQAAASLSPGAGWAVIALAFPVCAATAIGVDRILPGPGGQ